MTRWILKISLCFALMIAVRVDLLHAQTAGAMLYVHGDAKVNGTYVGNASGVFSGDRVDTLSGSSVSINRAGSSVVVNPDSSLKYDGGSVQVLSGSARVSTSKGMVAQAGQVTVAPANGSAKYDIINQGNQVLIASREGTITVNDGGRALTLGPGAQASFMLQGRTQVSQASNAPSASAVLFSPAPLYDLTSRAASDPAGLPFCTNVQLCQVRSSVSEVRACKCPFFF